MTIKKITLTAILSIYITGCSTLKELSQSKKPTLTQPIAYNFIKPRRTTSSLKLKHKVNSQPTQAKHLNYFSASGYQCQTLTTTTYRAACFIDGTWQETAPILSNKNITR